MAYLVSANISSFEFNTIFLSDDKLALSSSDTNLFVGNSTVPKTKLVIKN